MKGRRFEPHAYCKQSFLNRGKPNYLNIELTISIFTYNQYKLPDLSDLPHF